MSIQPFFASQDIPFLICRLCEVAVVVQEVPSHLVHQHSFTRSRARIIHQRTKALSSITQSQEELRLWQPPPATNTPVYGLAPPFPDGLGCKSCSYITRTIQRIQEHASRRHGWVNPRKRGDRVKYKPRSKEVLPWRENVQCQRLATSRSGRRLFEVAQVLPPQPQEAGSASARNAAYITLSQSIRDSEAGVYITQLDDRIDINPWVQNTGWADHLRGYQAKTLIGLAGLPTAEEDELWRADEHLSSFLDRARAITNESSLGRDALLELQRTEGGALGPNRPRKPFESRMENATWKRYKEAWRRIVAIVSRAETAADDELQGRPVNMTRRQATAYDEWYDTANRLRKRCTKEELGIADAKCLRWLVLLLEQKIPDQPYNSPIICALSIMGIRPDGSWAGPAQFTPILSAIVKVARIIVAFDAFTERQRLLQQQSRMQDLENAMSVDSYIIEYEDDTIASMFSLVRERMVRFMSRVSTEPGSYPTPMGRILDMRQFGLRISMSTPAQGIVQWSGEILQLKGNRLSVPDISEACHSLVSEAEELILEVTQCVDIKDLPEIPWHQIIDDHSDQGIGYSFLHDTRNQSIFQDWCGFIFERITKSPRLEREWLSAAGKHRDISLGAVGFKPASVDIFLHSVERLRQTLFTLMHLTSGQPARSTEILSLRVINTTNGLIRNLFIDRGLVMWVTLYHKGYRASGKAKVIYRFLPRVVGQLITWYLGIVLPFAKVLLKEVQGSEAGAPSPLLWAETLMGPLASHDEAGRHRSSSSPSPVPGGGTIAVISPATHKPWSSDKVRRILEQATERTLGQRVNIQDWRQIAIAIANRYLIGSSSSRAGSEHGSEADSDGEGGASYGLSVGDLAVVKQAGHGPHVAGMVYARQMQEAPFGMESQQMMYRAASVQWHNLLGFSSSRGLGLSSIPGPSVPATLATERQEALDNRKRELSLVDWEGQLQAFAGPSAMFRGQQRFVLNRIKAGFPRLGYVAATGSGKSLMFMLPAFASPRGTTVVVTPLVALQDDMLRRCESAGIAASIWSRSGCQVATIIFVTPELAVSNKFIEFANRLKVRQQLDRVVFDECHTLLDSSGSFRPLMQRLGPVITSWHTQELYLTATLPPGDEGRLATILGVTGASIQWVRSRTTRANITYEVHCAKSAGQGRGGGKGVLGAVKSRIRDWVTKGAPGRIIIYARTIAEVLDLGRELGCSTLHAKSGNREEKRRCVQSWIKAEDPMERVIVATSALGMGIDVSDVAVVIHVGMPWQLRDFAQESGRAGRDGRPALSVVVSTGGLGSAGPGAGPQVVRPATTAAAYIMPSSCRRAILDATMDNHVRRAGCEDHEALCDSCVEAQNREEARLLVVEAEAAGLLVKHLHPKDYGIESHELQMAQREVTVSHLTRTREVRETAAAARRFEAVARQWRNTCVLCWSYGHKWQSCLADHGVDMDDFEATAGEMQGSLFDKRLLQPFSACFACGFPQSMCSRFVPSPHDEGTLIPGGQCRQEGILPAVWAGLIHAAAEGPFDVMQNAVNAHVEQGSSWRWLACRIQWGHLTTNQLCRVLFGMWMALPEKA